MSTSLLYKDESYKIMGACFEVYKEKGCGFLESVYQECLEIEFRLQGIPYVLERTLTLAYKQVPLRAIYQPDFICFEKIIVEIKAVSDLTDNHRAQVQNYLRATGYSLAILVNFGHFPKVDYERIVAQQERFSPSRL